MKTSDLITIGKARLEFSAQDCERIAAGCGNPDQAAAALEMAAIVRSWKEEESTVLRWAGYDHLPVAA